jgi:DNA-directed RNA polymerase subunit RPC12/RpoP
MLLRIEVFARGPTSGRTTATLSRMELECPACGSDRVIPLSFPPVVRDEILIATPERPIAKCVECGHRLSALEVSVQETKG